jgi:hypothetical protein
MMQRTAHSGRGRFIAFMTSALACSEASHVTPTVVPVDTATPVIVHEAAAWDQLPVLEVDTIPVIVVGRGNEPGHVLRSVTSALITADLLLVADEATSEVRVFGTDGQFVRRIGSGGGGAGPIETLRAMQLRGDTLFVFDGAGRRMHFFSLDGEVLATESLVYAPSSRYRLADGSLAGVTPGDEVPDSITGVRQARAHVLHYAEAGAEPDTVARYMADEAWVTPGPSGSTSWILPFGRTPRVAFDDDDAVIACDEDFGYRQIAWQSGEERRVRVAVDARPVTNLDVARYRDAWGDYALGRGSAFALRFGSLSPDIFFRQTIPECGDVRIASDGHIWIAEYVLLRAIPREWTVFSVTGDLVARVRMPDGYRAASMTADRIVAVRSSPEGRAEVAVYINPVASAHQSR